MSSSFGGSRRSSFTQSLLSGGDGGSDDALVIDHLAHTQPVLDELRREEARAKRARRTSDSSASGQAAAEAAEEHDIASPSFSYAPPAAAASSSATAPVVEESSDSFFNRGRDSRAISYAAYTFAAHASRPNTNVAPASSSSGGLSASATDLELQVLAAGTGPSAAHDGAPEPLLLEYRKSTSNIRKDFTTVDWFFSKSEMHRLRRLLRKTNLLGGWKGRLVNYTLAAQAWIVLFLVGAATAVSASFVHTVGAWLTDVKEGYCEGNMFLTQSCMDVVAPGALCTRWIYWSDSISATSAGAYIFNYFIYTIFACLFATIASWVCVVFARQAAGSGIAEIKVVLGGFIIKKFFGIRTLALKTLCLTLAVASGMALGKEGPMVHVACAWGNILSRPFMKYATNEVKKREILSAAAAAGVTAAFGSPLGGVLFSLEVASSYFPPKTMWRSFWCAVCTALVLEVIDPFETGKIVLFSVTITKWHWFELIPMILIGFIGGAMGAAFVKLNVMFTTFRKSNRWLRSRPWQEICFIAFVTSIISYPNIYMRGGLTSLLAQLFGTCTDISRTDNDENLGSGNSLVLSLCGHDDSPWSQMGLILLSCIGNFFLATITYGSAIPSGVFMPSLCIGALMGRIIGWLMLEWHRSVGDTFMFSVCSGETLCVNPALYAVVGAAAVLGGVTRMTVSLAVIMFEVTGGLDIIVPIMVGVMCAKWCGDAFAKASLYGQLIELNGLPHIDTHEDLDLVDPAADCMTPEPVCLTTYGETIESLQAVLASAIYHGFPIIDNLEDRLVTGFIARSDLEYEVEKFLSDPDADPQTPCHFSREPPPFAVQNYVDWSVMVDRYPVQVRPSMPVDRVMTLFQSLGLRYLICCSPRGRMLGIIKKKDMLAYLMARNIHHR